MHWHARPQTENEELLYVNSSALNYPLISNAFCIMHLLRGKKGPGTTEGTRRQIESVRQYFCLFCLCLQGIIQTEKKQD